MIDLKTPSITLDALTISKVLATNFTRRSILTGLKIV